MVMQAQPVYDSWESIVSEGKKIKTIYLTPQGQTLTQDKVKELSEEEELILLCGHYEGIDERVLEEIVDEEISVGDYVLTGGELPAVMIIDAVSRLIPGVLHNDTSAGTESFENGLLEYPQYTRPETWHEKTVPKILLSGDHKKVDEWREEQSIERTKNKRPDLYDEYIKSGIQ
jgi:tRNA (guanine37-N1)-methyltransferase